MRLACRRSVGRTAVNSRLHAHVVTKISGRAARCETRASGLRSRELHLCRRRRRILILIKELHSRGVTMISVRVRDIVREQMRLAGIGVIVGPSNFFERTTDEVRGWQHQAMFVHCVTRTRRVAVPQIATTRVQNMSRNGMASQQFRACKNKRSRSWRL
jgi:hypothetical protein